VIEASAAGNVLAVEARAVACGQDERTARMAAEAASRSCACSRGRSRRSRASRRFPQAEMIMILVGICGVESSLPKLLTKRKYLVVFYVEW
jgi:hypothetical protein